VSSFIDLLEKTGQRLPSPLGFGASARNDQGPPDIVLIGRVMADALVADAELAGGDIDALLVAIGKADKKTVRSVSKAAGKRLWGVQPVGLDAEQVERLKEAGCDFLVLNPGTTSAAVLDDEDLGKFIPVDSKLEEGVARAIHDLPIDGALFGAEQLLPLTVEKLIDLQLVRGLIDGPFILSVPQEIGRADLLSLRNADVNGLVLDLSKSDKITTLRDTIAGLPQRRSRPSISSSPLVPQYGTAFSAPSHDHEHDDDGDLGDDEPDF
jgi:hypothetical protein